MSGSARAKDCCGTASRREVTVAGGRGYLVTKRLFDIAASLAAGVVLLIPMIIIGFLIRLESEGPAVYCQERLGKDGRPFIMYKFRTMGLDAEADGPCWAAVDDPRCTRLGRFLRRWHLDELPQLYNIFIGDMSFVGPRPERACFYEEFSRHIPNFHERLQVPPGLTGHAQVNGCGLEPEEKLRYDLEYMESRSMGVDIACMFRTVFAVLLQDGAG